MVKSTPWGSAQTMDIMADGIVGYTTASHGGICLDIIRQRELNWSDNWLKSAQWWEEDCDWAIPFYFFRNEIKKDEYYDRSLQSAINTIKNHHPEFAKREGLI